MRSRALLLTLALLLTCWPLPAASIDFPAFLHRLLLLCDYAFLPEQSHPAQRVYLAGTALVSAHLSPEGRLEGCGVFFGPYHDQRAYQGLGAAYLVLQMQLGKAHHYVQPGTLARKGRYLLEAVRHNLQHLETTVFPFDDLTVQARKLRQPPGVLIVLTPRP